MEKVMGLIGMMLLVGVFYFLHADGVDLVRVCEIKHSTDPGAAYDVETTEGTFYILDANVQYREMIEVDGTYKFIEDSKMPGDETIKALEPIAESHVPAKCS